MFEIQLLRRENSVSNLGMLVISPFELKKGLKCTMLIVPIKSIFSTFACFFLELVTLKISRRGGDLFLTPKKSFKQGLKVTATPS